MARRYQGPNRTVCCIENTNHQRNMRVSTVTLWQSTCRFSKICKVEFTSVQRVPGYFTVAFSTWPWPTERGSAGTSHRCGRGPPWQSGTMHSLLMMLLSSITPYEGALPAFSQARCTTPRRINRPAIGCSPRMCHTIQYI